MPPSAPRVVVVGAGAAGLATADALRAQGHAGEIVLLGDEPHAPYDRPPLSKQVLAGTWEPGRVQLRSAAELAEAGVDFRPGARAVALDTGGRSVSLADGTAVAYDELVVATGVAARRLPFGHDLAGVHVLRGLDEALALRGALTPDRRVVVVGAGFLGSEIAAAARELGARVALVDPLDRPLQTVLGDDLGAVVADLHAEHGVALHLGRGVASFGSRDGRVTSVVLDDRTVLDADLVVVAVGSVPAVDWLRSSGVPLAGPTPEEGAGGVRCDATGRAAAGVWAVGDVAAWWSGPEQRFVRVEHRLTATEHARTVARGVLGAPVPDAAAVPYFWSDQYDLTLRSFGLPSGRDELHVVEGSLAERRFVALYARAGRVTAVVGAGSAKAVRRWRSAVLERLTLDAALAAVA